MILAVYFFLCLSFLADVKGRREKKGSLLLQIQPYLCLWNCFEPLPWPCCWQRRKETLVTSFLGMKTGEKWQVHWCPQLLSFASTPKL